MKRLKYWYLKQYESEEESCVLAHGIVFGHDRLADGSSMHTSYVKEVRLEGKTAVVITRNSEYRCRLGDADFIRFDDEAKRLIPDFDAVRERYERKLEIPGQGEGVLLVLDNCAEYGFVAAALRLDGKVYEKRQASVNLSLVQDSVLVGWMIDGRVADYRYFPKDIFEFYTWTDTLDVWIENAGDMPIQVRVRGKEWEIPPRKRLSVKRYVYEELKVDAELPEILRDCIKGLLDDLNSSGLLDDCWQEEIRSILNCWDDAPKELDQLLRDYYWRGGIFKNRKGGEVRLLDGEKEERENEA